MGNNPRFRVSVRFLAKPGLWFDSFSLGCRSLPSLTEPSVLLFAQDEVGVGEAKSEEWRQWWWRLDGALGLAGITAGARRRGVVCSPHGVHVLHGEASPLRTVRLHRVSTADCRCASISSLVIFPVTMCSFLSKTRTCRNGTRSRTETTPTVHRSHAGGACFVEREICQINDDNKYYK